MVRVPGYVLDIQGLSDQRLAVGVGAWMSAFVAFLFIGLSDRFPLWVRGAGTQAGVVFAAAAIAVLFGAERGLVSAGVGIASLVGLVALIGWLIDAWRAGVREGRRPETWSS